MIAQADAVHAVVIQLVAPASDRTSDHETDDTTPPPRTLAFVGAGASATGITTGMDEALAPGFGRN